MKKLIFLSVLSLGLFSCSGDDSPAPDTPAQLMVSTIAGSIVGDQDGPGLSAKFDYPSGIAVDLQGNVYIADSDNNKIKKITPNGTVTTIAGTTVGDQVGTLAQAKFNGPSDLAVDNQGNIYIADENNRKIKKITPSGVVSVLAGSIRGDVDGAGTAAQFDRPFGIATDTQGNVYVTERDIHKIKKITPQGQVTTIAGSTIGYLDGNANQAKFDTPSDLVVDANGIIYVTDASNDKIRKITPQGVVSTYAGSTRGDLDGNALSAQFRVPRGIAVDAQGTLYIADFNHKIKKITPQGQVITIAGNGMQSFADGIALSASFNSIPTIAIDTQNNIYVCDRQNNKIRKVN